VANHKSALKRARQNEIRRMQNRTITTRLRHAIKSVRLSVTQGAAEQAQTGLRDAQALIDKAAKRGVIHPRSAARKISRLSHLVNTAKA